MLSVQEKAGYSIRARGVKRVFDRQTCPEACSTQLIRAVAITAVTPPARGGAKPLIHLKPEANFTTIQPKKKEEKRDQPLNLKNYLKPFCYIHISSLSIINKVEVTLFLSKIKAFAWLW